MGILKCRYASQSHVEYKFEQVVGFVLEYSGKINIQGVADATVYLIIALTVVSVINEPSTALACEF
jgi:hypothetical protein